jgi:hypothetical protein
VTNTAADALAQNADERSREWIQALVFNACWKALRQPNGGTPNTWRKCERMKTLPSDSAARKEIPLSSGLIKYFPAALAGVARISKLGNDKHNPGEPLNHAREKSGDHDDALIRHFFDFQDALAAGDTATALVEADSIAWRALALSQELHEGYAGAPLAPAARLPGDCREADRMRERDEGRVIG